MSARDDVRCYEPLVQRIRADIDSGKLQPGQKVGTESGFAREAGLSRNSIRAGIDLLIEDGVVERRPGKGIFVVAAPDAGQTIQVVVPQFADPFHQNIVQGVQDACRQRGLLMQVQDAHGRVQDDLALIRSLPENSTSGAIIIAEHHPELLYALFDLQRREYPFVLVDKKLVGLPAPSVVSDNYQGGYLIGQKLIELGHRQIAVVVDPEASTAADRVDGLRDALSDADVAFKRSRIVECYAGAGCSHSAQEWLELMTDATRKVLALEPRPTAVFYWNDDAAAYGCRALHEMGVSIPDDISVVGFDDSDVCEVLHPPLASVYQPVRQMGEEAVELLMEWIDRKQVPWDEKDRVLPVEFHMRASLASIN